ncbi:MAG: NAD(P)-dependent oxidoreductase [Stygiobacter sp.]|nr:MAG: NAD(P)-dependent oxidoreductase [Stygiobacter sp.]
MKIFITGGSGLIGQYLNVGLSKSHEILTQFYKHIGNCGDYNSAQFAINDYEALESTFKTFNPEIAIHTAAISNAERADQLPADEVYDVNVNATKYIAELCKTHNAKLIYTSSDLVYAGYRGSYLTEESKLIPISLYAETKLMGEVKVRKTLTNHIILRVALQFGFGLNHSRSHFQFIYDELKNGRKVKLFSDQYRSVLSLKESARMIAELITKDVSGEMLNFGGTERVSRYDLGKEICRVCNFDESLIEPVTMERVNATYKVADVSMNIDKLKKLGIEPKSLGDSMQELLTR